MENMFRPGRKPDKATTLTNWIQYLGDIWQPKASSARTTYWANYSQQQGSNFFSNKAKYVSAKKLVILGGQLAVTLVTSIAICPELLKTKQPEDSEKQKIFTKYDPVLP